MLERLKNLLSRKTQKEKRAEEILFPVIRVRTHKAGGSGTILYSDEEKTYALTNNHVIRSAIVRDIYWDTHREEERLEEKTKNLFSEFFDWRGLKKQFASSKFEAEVVMRDKNRDIALIEIDLPKPYPYVAEALERDTIEDIEVYDQVWHTGAQLGHEPISTKGHIMYLPEIIDRHMYVMSSAPTIFGSSGGAMYLNREDTFKYCGISSRISVAPVGFSGDPQQHMSYWIHPEEIYRFLEEWHFDFILDKEKSRRESEKKREEKREKLLNEWCVKK